MIRPAPKPRVVMIGGRSLLELIRGALENRVGFVADIINVQSILESLLEDYFYGGSFQDQFYEHLASYSVPTDSIEFIRKEILRSLAEQVRGALGEIQPSCHYSFELKETGDLMITELPPPRTKRPSLSLVG